MNQLRGHQTPGKTERRPWARPGATAGRPAAAKRLLDLTLGSALLVVTAPLLVAALIVAACRPGDGVFFREVRTGLHGRPFTLRCLRTRRFRLDLLSRLHHVVRGQLSLVGPAPLRHGSRRAAAPWRHRVRPGLTGTAQLRRYSRLPWNEASLLDQHYVDHYWLGVDLTVLVRTLPALYIAHRQTHTSVRSRVAARLRLRRGPSRLERALSDTDHRLRNYIAAG